MAESSPTILEVDDLRRHYGGVRAVDGASFTVQRGSITSLIGPNGAGKTTAFNLLTGFARPDTGRVVFEGSDVAGHRSDRVARRGMVRTFQLTRVLGKMRVIENVMLAAQQQPGERFVTAFLPTRWRSREEEIRHEAAAVLEQVGLSEKAEDYAATLSGGQRKLLELARALMARPRLLMLDEPMAGVNPTLGREILASLDRLRHETGLTVMFIEHDMDVVMDISDEVIVMGEGRVITQGTPDAVRSDQRVIDAYLSGGSGHE
ncbi:MAG: ABC transporter ATP-binding protein [Actinobacteria bacterium]|nr:ABC transporter ATP-binding protein [Thermoleophilia bacterium]MCB9010881.1 ABC transporter ATP-binding protein [Actinomycetota bacterium]